MDSYPEPKPIWTAEIGRDSRGSVLKDGKVYVTFKEGYLVVVDAETGENYRTIELESHLEVLYKPDIVDGVAYIADRESRLHAVDVEKGEILWVYEDDDEDQNQWFEYGVQVEDSTVYTISDGGRVYALDSETGELKWKRGESGPVNCGVHLYDGTLYYYNGIRGLFACDPSTGDEQWSEEYERTAFASFHEGVFYYIQKRSDDTFLEAYDLTDRELIWSTLIKGKGKDIPLDFSGTPTHMAFSDKGVFLTTKRNMYGFDIETGSPIWELLDIVEIGDNAQLGKPAIDGDHLCVQFGQDTIVIHPETCEVYHHFGFDELDRSLSSLKIDASIEDGIAYVATPDEVLYAFKVDDEPIQSASSSLIDETQATGAQATETQSTESQPTEPKNPTHALGRSVVGLFIPILAGWGQIYNGQQMKGGALCGIQCLNLLLMGVLIGFLLYPATALYILYDSYSTAKKSSSQNPA